MKRMKQMKTWALVWVVAALGLTLPAAAIDYSGTCTGTIPAAGSPHQLVSTCTVPAGMSLTFEAGAVLESQGYALNVYGTLGGVSATLDFVFLRVYDGGVANLDQSVVSGSSSSLTFYSGSAGSITNSTLSEGSGGCRVSISNASPTISGNTFTSVSTAVCVDGSSTLPTVGPTIENNSIETSWHGISYTSGTIGGLVRGNTIAFVGPSSGRTAIELRGEVSPTVDNNTILDDPSKIDTALGIFVNEQSAAQVTDNDLCVTGDDVPLRLDPRLFADSSTATISNNVFSCESGAGVTLNSSSLHVPTTFAAVNGQATLVLPSTVSTASGVPLTIVSGLTLSGGTLSLHGPLHADGVTFDATQLYYYDGSGGTLENSVLSGNNPIYLQSSSVVAAASPLIRNNTVTSSNSTAINVFGTSTPALEGNQITTNHRGIWFAGTSGGSATGNQIGFVPEGSSNRLAIGIDGDASPLVDSNTLLDDPIRSDSGIWVGISPASTAQVTGNDICATGMDGPLLINPGFFATQSTAVIADNVFNCGLGDGVTLLGATVTEATTVAAVNGQDHFNLASSITVNGGQQLTLASGLTLTGNGTIYVQGVLDANGVHFEDVRLQYSDGSGGVIENSVISGLTPVNLSGSSVTDPAAPTLRNNTIDGISRAVRVDGTAQPVIEGNIITTQGVGIGYFGAAAGRATGNQIGFQLEGFSNRRAVEVFGDASPIVDANVMLDDPTRTDLTIDLLITADSAVEITNNDFCVTGEDTALRLSIDAFADTSAAIISGNTYSCESGRPQGIQGTTTADATLRALDGQGAFRLTSTVYVSAGHRLSIDPGVDLDGAYLSFWVDGELQVDGAQLRDTYIYLQTNSEGTIDNSTLSGSGLTFGLDVTNATLSLTDTTLSGYSSAVVLRGQTTATISGNVFTENNTALDIRDPEAMSMLVDNHFDSNSEGLRFGDADSLFSAFPAGFSTSTFTGPGGSNGVLLPSQLNVSGILPSSPVPYKNIHNLRLTQGAQVTLQAGTVIQSSSFRTITAEPGTRLVALGTAEFPVVFTDLDPADGNRWFGLILRDDASLLQGCIIEFSSGDGLRLESASVPLTDCVVSGHAGDGIELTGDSAPLITDSSIILNLGDGLRAGLVAAPAAGSEPRVDHSSLFSNGGLGINNLLAADFDVIADSNYWGDDSGPFDGSDDTASGGLFNPTGQGQSVGDGVAYDPWIRLGPTQAGVILALSGSGQVGTVGSTLPEPLVVEIQSNLGTPLEGVEVIFSIVEGDAEVVESQPLVTDADGRAGVSVRLGTDPGQVLIAVTARDVDSPLATFMAETDGACLMRLVAEPLEPAPGLGDVDANGRVDNRDAALVQAVLDGVLDEDSPLLERLEAADVNVDGAVNRGDLLALQSYVVGQVFWTPAQ